MVKTIYLFLASLIIVSLLILSSGCDSLGLSDESSVTTEEATGEKTVLVWCREGVRNATMNGEVSLVVGQDNSVAINEDQPLWVEFDYTDSYGRDQNTRIDLDAYYDYFILRETGGWTQLKYQSAYDEEKYLPQ